MSIDVVSRKLLWGRAGNSCAMSTCRRNLAPSIDPETGKTLAAVGVILGEEAHIRSSKPDGPRHVAGYGNFDVYGNLVLLCPTHHTLIDKGAVEDWPIERIERIKSEHEEWVRQRLSPEEKRTLDVEVLMTAEVHRVEELLFEAWPMMHWRLQQAIPGILEEELQALIDVGLFLLKKDWPPDYPEIRLASDRLRSLIGLLIEHVNNEFEPVTPQGPYLRLGRPEKHISWNPKLYAELSWQTELNMTSTFWLAEALGASLNYWISAVRDDLDPYYRFSEGVLLAPQGDGIVYAINHVRLEYDRTAPMPGLPQTLRELKDVIEKVARDKSVTPQYVRPTDVAFD
jgi:hypothetical protein